MKLGSLTKPELIFSDLPGADRPTVLRAMAVRLSEYLTISDVDGLYRQLWQREELGSTAIGKGVAIPHCKVEGLEQVVMAIGLCPRGVEYDSEDGQPVRLLFLLLSPEHAPAEHLQSLAAISKWVKADRHVERILAMDDAQTIFDFVAQEGA